MTKCVFCGREEPDFTGVHLIKNDGSVDYYCSSKCRKNALKLGRDRRNVRWTEAFRLQRHKEAQKAKAAKKEEVKQEIKVEAEKKEIEAENKK